MNFLISFLFYHLKPTISESSLFFLTNWNLYPLTNFISFIVRRVSLIVKAFRCRSGGRGRLIVRRVGCGREDSFTRGKAEGRWLIDNLQTAWFQRKKSIVETPLLVHGRDSDSVVSQHYFFFFLGQVQLWLKFVDWRIYYLDSGFN